MLLKTGVDISRLRPEIRKKLPMISAVVVAIEGGELVIVSTYEGNHSPGSLHYADLAVNIRSGKHKDQVGLELGRVLGPDYDVVVEMTHIHIEYDPK